MGKKITKFLFAIFLITLLIVMVFQLLDKNKELEQEVSMPEEVQSLSSNIIKDVKYISSDAKGNRYTITARTGEIDYSDPNTIFLTEVNALIELNNSNNIEIVSDFGKYNTVNFDTIFSKNVIVHYLDNKITGEYLDFSIKRGTMIISKNVIYSNTDNILGADIIEINIENKDTKISMYDKNKKVNIRSKKYNGNN
tara:strand:+ start:259 stop:846 length:588 start_codon:yes stop_codon:yes gene_type:complete